MKRLISIFMSAAIAFTSLTASLPAYAEESAPQLTEQVQNTPKASGTGTVGTLLSEEINEELTEQQGNQGFNVFAAEVEENVVTITFEALEDCTLVTAILDDAGEVLLYTESVDVLAGQTEAELTIAAEEMPQYFTLHAYLIDSDTFRPLCTVYECYTYTQEMQEFLAKTIEDFDQELVVSFDGSTDTNFGVFAEGTVILDYVEGVNTVASVDEENNVYVFENADENITGLTAGTIMAYPYSDEIFLIVKVATVEVDGTTATVTGTSIELEEAFEYLRIEAESNGEDIILDNENLDDGVAFEGIVEDVPESDFASDISDVPSESKDFEGEYSKGIKIEYKIDGKDFGEDNCKAEIKGSVGFSVSFSVKYYITFSMQQIEAKLEYKLESTLSVSGEVKAAIPLSYMTIPIAGCINVAFTPSVIAEAKAEIKLSFVLSSSIGFNYYNGTVTDTSTSPQLDFELEAEGKLFVGVSLEPQINIISEWVANVELEAKAGVEIVAKYEKSVLEDDKSKHACNNCISGEINKVIELVVRGELLKIPALSFEVNLCTWKLKLHDFYYSFDHNEFAFKKCPHKAYLLTLKVTNEYGNPLAYATVTDGNITEKTNYAGIVKTYLEPGTYRFTINHKLADDVYEYIEVKNQPLEIVVELDIYDETTEETGDTIESTETAEDSSETSETSEESDEPVNISDGFEYEIANGMATVTKYVGMDTDVAIPVMIHGIPVTKIADKTFYNNLNIVSVYIPINVTTIGENAFYGCTSLETINIPRYLSSISTNAFNGCTGIQEFDVSENNQFYCDVDGVLFNKGMNNLLHYTTGHLRTSYEIPSTIHGINECAFSGSKNLTSVTIPSSVTTIAYSAFSNCSVLNEINFSEGLNIIGQYAFSNCDALESITLPEGLTEISDGIFNGCDSLTDVTLPSDMVEISAGMFSGCTSLQKIDIPNCVKKIGRNAFQSCIALESIVLPNSITEMDDYVFYGCSNLTNAVLSNKVEIIPKWAFAVCKKLKNIQIPNSVKRIDNYAFENCTSITEVIIPDSVEYLGEGAFQRCSLVEKVVVPSSVTEVGRYLFYYCSNLKDITIGCQAPINADMFDCCWNVEKITINEGVTAIGTNAFCRFEKLSDLTLASTIKSIGDFSFSACYALESVKILEGTEKIDRYAFNGCYNLKSITIPSSVSSIDQYSFFDCQPTMEIHGVAGSYASSYASKYGFPFYTIVEDSESFETTEVTSEPATTEETAEEVTASDRSSALPEEFTHTTTADTASFTGLIAGETYNFYVLRDLDAEAPLGSENLLYISQHVVGEDGTLSVTYKPLADDYNAVAFVEQMSPFDISSADVTIPTIIANGSTRYIQPVVMLDGEALEIGADFEIGGDYPVIEAGTYTAVITGIGDYTGVINAEYELLSEDNKSIDIAAVLSYPTKTAYAYGESLDLTGGVIEVYYNNDTFEEVPMTADMISGFDSTKTGAQTLTITYGELTAEYTITVAEKTVTKPILTAKAGDGKVNLTWTVIDGATKYNVYIYTTGYKLLATVTDTSYTATGLTNGTKYGFLVRAFVNGAWTAFTTADNVYATPIAALKPVVTATAGEEQVKLSWNALDGATNYRVFSYLNGKYAVLGETTATTYTASDLTAGTKYGFLVRAFVNGAWTAFSNDDVVYATPTAAVVTKPEVTATAGDGEIDLTWNAIAGATKYNVYIYTTGYKMLTTTTETSYTATDLENGTKYGFLVRAYVNGTWTTFTTADNIYATPEAAVVTKPVVTATAGSGEVELEWNAVTGATKYNVYIYTTGYKLLATVTDTSYTATGLTNGTKYGFLVRAYVNGAWTAFTTADNVYATPKAASTKPEFTATAGIGMVTLDWEPVEGATNYNVFTYLNGKYAVAGTTTDTTYTVTDLEAGTKYGFLVRAYVNNAWSPFTTADNVYATPTAALKPVLTVTAGTGSADLSWTAVAGATNYRVFSYLNGKYTEITVTSDTSCTATGLTSGTEYGFLVRAYVNNAWTAFSTDDVSYAAIL